MAAVVGFVSGLLSFAIAVFSARPLANLMDKWFNMSASFSGFLSGNGRFISLLICGGVVYLICRLVFWVIAKFIIKIKEGNKVIDKMDKIAGLVLGIAKCIVSVCMMFVTIHLLTSIGFMATFRDWLLNGSYIGSFIYGLVERLIFPLLGDLLADAFAGAGG